MTHNGAGRLKAYFTLIELNIFRVCHNSEKNLVDMFNGERKGSCNVVRVLSPLRRHNEH